MRVWDGRRSGRADAGEERDAHAANGPATYPLFTFKVLRLQPLRNSHGHVQQEDARTATSTEEIMRDAAYVDFSFSVYAQENTQSEQCQCKLGHPHCRNKLTQHGSRR